MHPLADELSLSPIGRIIHEDAKAPLGGFLGYIGTDPCCHRCGDPGDSGDPASKTNRTLMAQAQGMAEARTEQAPLNISFFDAAAVKVWG